MIFRALLVSLCLISAKSNAAYGETTEERFQDIFVTAGYATAIGAGLGAASLSFYNNPEERLKHVAIGASLGFIGGTLLGSYVVLSPVIANHSTGKTELLASDCSSKCFSFRPVLTEALELKGISVGIGIADF